MAQEFLTILINLFTKKITLIHILVIDIILEIKLLAVTPVLVFMQIAKVQRVDSQET